MKHPTNLLVLGAGGQIAHWVIPMLSGDSDVKPTLFLRNAKKLGVPAPKGSRIVEGDVLDEKLLASAMEDQDSIYANLAGDVDVLAKHIIAAMKTSAVARIVFVTALGIYDEVPGKFGQWNRRALGSYLDTYRRAADLLEESGLSCTILRPAWLTDKDEVDYEVTRKGEPFKGTEVSRKSVAAVAVEAIRSPGRWSGGNIGLNKPNTDGDKPAFC